MASLASSDPVGTAMRGRAAAYPASPCGTTSDRPSQPPRRLSTTSTLPSVVAPYAVEVKTLPTIEVTTAPPRPLSTVRRDVRYSEQPQPGASIEAVIAPRGQGC
jgi:hypothetical protein